MAKLHTEPSKSATQSTPDEAIIELRPPPSAGFSGTIKLRVIEQASFIEELTTKRGYTVVHVRD